MLYLDPGTYLNRKEARFISLITDKKIGHDYLIRGIPQVSPSFPTTVYIRAIASTSPYQFQFFAWQHFGWTFCTKMKTSFTFLATTAVLTFCYGMGKDTSTCSQLVHNYCRWSTQLRTQMYSLVFIAACTQRDNNFLATTLNKLKSCACAYIVHTVHNYYIQCILIHSYYIQCIVITYSEY